MAIYLLGTLESYQQTKVLAWLKATYSIMANLDGSGRLETLTRDLTAQEQTALDAQVVTIKSSVNPAVYSATTIADLKARLIAAYPGLRGKTVAEIRTIVAGQIGGWGTLANAKTDLQQWLPDLIAAVLVLILNGE